MALSPDVQERIDALVRSDKVVLFMKGSRRGPQCGFSAQVVQILDRVVPDYTTVDVLADPAIREGIKAYSSWPTIPQLYVAGEFVGGCDIVREMFESGELYAALGVERPTGKPPTLHVTDAAATELRRLAEDAGGRTLHLVVDARHQPGLYFGPAEENEVQVVANGIPIALDLLSALRAENATIDVRQTADGPAFHVALEGAGRVRQLEPREVKTMLDEGRELVFVDVRTPEEREKARIPGTRLLDDALRAELEALPHDTPIVFHCHHGGRSQRAAEHFAALGFRNVANLAGGIDAWSQQVDPSIPRY